ncbi:MAG: glycosyltransferase [Candidatus Contendobacter sp.]
MEHSVSVVIPLYNHEKFIEAAIESVLNQTTAPAEIIVINDGSSDHSHLVMQRLSEQYPQIHYCTQPNQGAHATINAAIAKASCPYIAILNSDDLYQPRRLERCLQQMLADPAVAMVVTAIEGINEKGETIELVWYDYYKEEYQKTGDLFLALSDGNFLLSSSNVFVKKNIFDELGNFAYFRYAHDLDFFLRLLTHHKRIIFIDEPLLKYRIHQSNTIREDHHKVFLERDKIVAFYIYCRIARAELLTFKGTDLTDIIKILAASGRLETIFYYFCYFLQNSSESADFFHKNKPCPDPGFYWDRENPPDSFLRWQQAITAKNLPNPMAAAMHETQKELTEFQTLAQIAVTKAGERLRYHPLLSAACIKIMRNTWRCYRYLKMKSIKNFFRKIYLGIQSTFSRPHYVNQSDEQSNLLPAFSVNEGAPIVFVSHDAGRTGAPIVLLHLLCWIKKNTSLNFIIVLRGGGELVDEFTKLGPVLLLSDFSPTVWREKLYDFIRESSIKLIYSNTAVNGDVIDHLKSIINAPVISAIHELENSIQRFAPGRLFDLVKKHTDSFIAVSDAVKKNLEYNHGIPSAKINLIHPFIPVTEIRLNLSVESVAIRQELGISQEMFIIGGSGTLDWRKGADLFIHTALAFLKTLTNKEQQRVKFVWVGGDLESLEMAHLNHDIKHIDLLSDRIIFTGNKQKTGLYFSQFSAFLLSSREDPFPLVCLEAGALEKPVICFDKAGGIPDLVENDAGFIVPYLDINQAAQVLHQLFIQPELSKRMGRRIADKVQNYYDIEMGAKQILALIDQISLKIQTH